MIKNNSEIKWFPEFVGTQRFNNWLEGAPDWCLSRDRFWGTPIPIWESEDDIICIGSKQELFDLVGYEVNNLHREHIDDIVIDGGNVGATDSTGSVYYDVPNASVDTDHTLQICYCFDTKGGCRQQKITMVVNTGKDKPVCEVLESCDQIEVTNIIETTVNTFVCNTNNTRTE